MIRTILLDFGRVLAYPKSGSWFIPPKTVKILGAANCMRIGLRPKKRRASFKKAFAAMMQNHVCRTREEEVEQFTAFYEAVFADFNIPDAKRRAGELAASRAYDDSKILLYPDTLAALASLKKDYRVAVLSDAWPSVRHTIEQKGILQHLDGLVLSCDFGAFKERIELFHYAIETLGLVPEETLFVDDLPVNLENARAAGMHPVLMDRRGRAKRSTFPVVYNLGEIRRAVRETEENERKCP